MPQFLANKADIDEKGKTAILRGEEARHLSLSTRGRTGDEVFIFDGDGNKFRGIASLFTKDSVTVSSLIPIPSSEPEARITVAQALIKGDRWEWFLEKAVELGACEIIPLVTEHTVVRPEKGEGPKKLQRWEKILLAAAKQSGRAKIPSIGEPLALEKWLSGMGKNDGAKKLVCSERDGECATLPEKGENIIVAVGPEGGWSESELGAFSRKGFAPLSLGPLILRSETAALKALSLLCR